MPHDEGDRRARVMASHACLEVEAQLGIGDAWRTALWGLVSFAEGRLICMSAAFRIHGSTKDRDGSEQKRARVGINQPIERRGENHDCALVPDHLSRRPHSSHCHVTTLHQSRVLEY